MKRLSAATAAIAQLAGCDPGPPNGMDAVLFFERDRSSAQVGSTQTIYIPRRARVGGYVEGKGLPYRTKVFHYEFDGTRLEAALLPDTATVVSATLGPAGYDVVLRCDAASRGEIHFRVMHGSTVRYSDRTFFECTPALAR